MNTQPTFTPSLLLETLLTYALLLFFFFNKAAVDKKPGVNIPSPKEDSGTGAILV